MKRLLFSSIVAATALNYATAADGGKKLPIYPAKRLESKAEIQKRLALKEAAFDYSAAALNRTKPVFPQKRQGNGSNSTQSTVVFSDLGKSINPFTSVTAGRNYVAANPALNTVALFRRGSEDDLPLAQSPGNKLFYDLNTKGGAEGQWQVKRGMLFDNSQYPVGANNYGPRYPQGTIYNPPGNTDTAQAVAFGHTRVLDGTNDAWGGLGNGWQRLAAGSPTFQTLWGSMQDPVPVFHFRQYGLDLTSTGAIFSVEPEEDLSSGSVVFTDKVMVYKYMYNSQTQRFDSTVTFLPFANSLQDPPTESGDCQVAFGPDGQTGYVIVNGYNPDFATTFAYTPYVAKTTNGGATWSDFTLINFNRTPEEVGGSSPCKKSVRDAMLGDYVIFTTDSLLVANSSTDPGAHAVDYIFMDFDLTVDAFNNAHFFGIACVAGFGDTLLVTGPGYYRPGYGSWNVHIVVPPNDYADTRAQVISQNQGLQGCWGDCATQDNITEFNRPHISRSADGTMIVMSWYDTDQEAHPQSGDYNNSNPDLWYKYMRVLSPDGFRTHDGIKNATAGSDYDGLIVLGSVAPTLLNNANGFSLPSTMALLSEIGAGGTALWPISHLYVGGVNIPNIADSSSIEPTLCRFTSTKRPVASAAKGLKMEIMPNPSKGFLSTHLSVEKAGIAQIKVMNAMGQLVSSSSQELPAGEINVPFNFRHLKNGVYFLSIQVGNQISTQRFVKE